MNKSAIITSCVIGIIICSFALYYAVTDETCEWCCQTIDAVATVLYEHPVPEY